MLHQQSNSMDLQRPISTTPHTKTFSQSHSPQPSNKPKITRRLTISLDDPFANFFVGPDDVFDSDGQLQVEVDEDEMPLFIMERRFRDNKIKIKRVLNRIAANGPPKLTEKDAKSIIEELK